MENPTYLAINHQAALQRQMEVIANNLANASTSGFKSERILFAEMLNGRASNPGLTEGSRVAFVEEIGMLRDTRDGQLVSTNNQMDLAISGPGYFAVETPGGVRYTRDGRFRLASDGRIVSQDGFALLDQQGRPMSVRPGESRFEVQRNGRASGESGEIGRIQIATFENDQTLRPQGGGLYASDTDPQQADARSEIQQGMVEGSNVQTVVEMTNMIEVLRRYQSAQKIIDNENDRERKAIERLGRVG
jgi:flagellar basal-body rod protein FlgF